MIEKSKVFEALKDEYAENPLVSERTINAALERMMRYINDDTKEDEFLDDVKSLLKEVEGNARKVAADTAKKVEAKNKPAPKEDQKPKSGEGEPPKDDGEPEWMTKLLSKLDSYDKRFAEEDKRRTAEQVRKSAFAKANIYPQNVLEVAADGFDFGQENAEATFIEKAARTAGKFGIVPERGESKDKKPTFDALRAELDAQTQMIN